MKMTTENNLQSTLTDFQAVVVAIVCVLAITPHMEAKPGFVEFEEPIVIESPNATIAPLADDERTSMADSQCIQGCGACAEACPSGVSISDVLRIGMYDRDYGEPELARSAYAELGAGAAACLGCAARTCAGACPFGVEIEKLTAPTHRRLAPAG